MSRSFDVFVSHSSVDKPWVRQLVQDLRRYGVTVWVDEEEIRPGSRIVDALEESLEACRAMSLVVSPESMTSGWVKEEYSRALALALRREAPLQLIPVLLRDAALPGFLASRSWVDFRDRNAYADSVWRLVWGITGQKPSTVHELDASDEQGEARPGARTADRPAAPARAPAPVALPQAVQDELVELLEACHALRDVSQRRSVVQRLDSDIATRIADLSAMRPHVTEMVKTCAAFPDGLRQLRAAVRWYEGKTTAMAQVDALLARLGVALDGDA